VGTRLVDLSMPVHNGMVTFPRIVKPTIEMYETWEEFAERIELPFPILSDSALALVDAIALPTFEADRQQLYKRITLVIRDGAIEHAFYPIFPPSEHAGEVLAWLRSSG